MKNLILLALLTITFHPEQWQAIKHSDSTGTWWTYDGPDHTLAQRLVYDEQGHYWEVEEGTKHEWSRTPLRDQDVITLDDKGTIRVKFHYVN